MYGLHGIYLDAYDAVVKPDNVWPISHYVLRRWASTLGASAFWLLVTLQQLGYRNSRSADNSWCQVSRRRIAEESSLSESSIHRLLHEESYRATGLCHWVRFQGRRSWSNEAGTVVQQPNRYDIVLAPPLATVDQRGLAQFLLENGVERGTDITAVIPPLKDLARQTSLDDLLVLLEDCAERFSPPSTWLADAFLHTPLDIVRALKLGISTSQREMETVAQVCSQVHQALTRQPQVLLQTNYFRHRWLPRLGHTSALLVVVLRSRCFWNAQALRDTVTMYPLEMARAIGLASSRQVTRSLNKPDVRRFISVLDSGRGKPVEAKITLREPIAPENQPQYQRLLLGNPSGQQEEGENRHFEHQTNDENGHFEHLISATTDILNGGMDILNGGNGHFEHHVSTTITVSTCRSGKTLKQQQHVNAPAAAALLEEFGIGSPNDKRILARNPYPDDVRAWMLYTLTQPGLDKPTAYVVKRLLTGESPPARFRRWAELTPDQWRTLWRAGHYGDLYPAPPDLAEALDDWLEDFGDIFPAGPFGDGHRVAAEWSEWRTQRRQGQRREEPERDPSVNTMIGDVTAAQLWSAALDNLQRQMTQATFDAWLRDSKLM
ncbi:MAG: hypothetical protein DRI81_15860, partial [Chloroflexi bacterium]